MLRRSNFSLYLALAGICAIFIYMHNPGATSVQESEEPAPSSQLLLMGRHVIGTRMILQETQQGFDARTQYAQLLNVVDTPWDHLRLAPLAAELLGAEDALKVLENLEADAQANHLLSEDRVALKQLYMPNAPPLDEDTVTRLRQRHGWFAEVALVFHQPPDSEAREVAFQPARRAAQVMLIGVSGISLAIFLGFALLAYYVFFLARKQRSAYEELADYLPRGSSVFMEVTVLMLALMPFLSFVGGFLPRPMAIFLQLVPLFAAFWGVKRGLSPGHLFGGMGWFPGRGFFAEIRAGVLGYIAGLPILLLGLGMTVILGRFFEGNPTHPAAGYLESADRGTLIFIVLLACVIAPIVEESIFRGAFYQHLRGRWKPIPAALFQAFVFAAIHPQGVIAIPTLMSLGFVFAGIREWRGSILASIVAHSINNGLVTFMMIMILR